MNTTLAIDPRNLEDLSSCTESPTGLESWIEEAQFSSTGSVERAPLPLGGRELGASKEEPLSSSGSVERAPLPLGGRELTASTEIDNVVSLSRIKAQITALFRRAREEVFEDGMMSDFISDLLEMISLYEIQAIEAIHDLLGEHAIEAEIKGEALRWLGEVEQESTYVYRRWLLEKNLMTGEDIAVVDGANIGLSFMDDPHSITCFKKAIEKSPIPIVCQLLELTLVQLEESKRAKAAEKDKTE